MAKVNLNLELPPTFHDEFVAAWDIVNPDLEVVARGSFLDRRSDEASLPPGKYWARVELPNNKRESRPFVVAEQDVDLAFEIKTRSRHEWLGWATLSEAPSAMVERARDPALHDLWACTWALGGDDWTQNSVANDAQLIQDGSLLQLELAPVPDRLCALQLGGNIASRFLIVPPQGIARVLISASVRESGPGSETDARPDVEVTVSFANSVADHLARFLVAGSPSAWEALDAKLIQSEGMALLYGKRGDPLGAAVAGYILMQSASSPPPLDWLRNLSEWTPWLADGPILSAYTALRSGKRSGAHECTEQLLKASERGYPVLRRGIDVFLDTVRLLRSSKVDLPAVIEERCELFAAVRASSTYQTAFTTFYGELPSAPRGFTERPDTIKRVRSSATPTPRGPRHL